MIEKNYKRKYEFQKKMNLRQSEMIEKLKARVEELELMCKEKDDEINSIDSLRVELTKNVNETKKYKKEYEELIKELREMKNTINKEVYNGKWSLVKFLIK